MLERWQCDIERIWHTDVQSISFRLTWCRGAGKPPARNTHTYTVSLYSCDIYILYIYLYIYIYMINVEQLYTGLFRAVTYMLCHVNSFVRILSYSHNTSLYVIQEQLISTSNMLSLFILNQTWTRKEGHMDKMVIRIQVDNTCCTDLLAVMCSQVDLLFPRPRWIVWFFSLGRLLHHWVAWVLHAQWLGLCDNGGMSPQTKTKRRPHEAKDGQSGHVTLLDDAGSVVYR